MNNFTFYSPTFFSFGKDAEKDTGALVKRFGGSRVLIHYGGGSVVRSGLLDRVKSSLEKEGLPYFELGGVKPNPRSGLVYEGIELCRKEKIDFVLAVGGGSVIDSSKAIAAGT
ncbi:MAG: iron-containing alcohol dehydrogenase, partial [Lachnospiraceae bacterium]|nr:iron-containing alcohol dehydrogenase [Lachnospiraceae bacterium]